LELAVVQTIREKTKLSAAVFCLCVFGSASAAAVECAPHCDYYHYYGPYDFTYVRPDLYAYPLCGPRGNCSPYLVYSTSGVRRGRIEIRFPRRRPSRELGGAPDIPKK
jgi:hypothetical protein